ncbi:uncharacterized protein LOC115376449 [Myripristis murdjan]|uniref:uncharacterized protein LOC115376449 n=1 Tax=Myripristis murdjan TaxID=586833 RepID=UPI0011761E18|nr:uncharacterized protein LOC115376449 [Myripristis murdjan]
MDSRHVLVLGVLVCLCHGVCMRIIPEQAGLTDNKEQAALSPVDRGRHNDFMHFTEEMSGAVHSGSEDGEEDAAAFISTPSIDHDAPDHSATGTPEIESSVAVETANINIINAEDEEETSGDASQRVFFSGEPLIVDRGDNADPEFNQEEGSGEHSGDGTAPGSFLRAVSVPVPDVERGGQEVSCEISCDEEEASTFVSSSLDDPSVQPQRPTETTPSEATAATSTGGSSLSTALLVQPSTGKSPQQAAPSSKPSLLQLILQAFAPRPAPKSLPVSTATGGPHSSTGSAAATTASREDEEEELKVTGALS